MELRVGESKRKFVLQPGHLRESDGVDGGHPHLALDARLQLVERGAELLLTAQDVAAEVEVELAGGCQRQRPGGAIEESSTQLLLELLNVLAGGGLTDPAVRGSAGD